MNARSRSRVLVAILTAAAVMPAAAQVSVLGVQYRPDQPFPEHECFWDASRYPGDCGTTSPLGGTIHVFLRNTGTSSVTVQDVIFAGESLADILRLHFQVVKRQPASIWLDNLPADRLHDLLAAGEPVWYKADPATIAPGRAGHVVVRLRQTPQVPSIGIDVIHTAGTTSAVVPVQSDQPQLVGAFFSPDLATTYLYWRRTPGTGAPVGVLLDGIDVTAGTTTVADASLGFAASVVQLNPPLTSGSLHVFEGVYADGRTAGAGVRAWNNEFIYGTWGARAGAEGDYAAARAWIDEAALHSVNALVVQGGSEAVKDYLKTDEGKQYAAARGYGCVIEEIGLWGYTTPLMWFIRDEPDAADSRVTDIPEDKKVGSLAQMAVPRGEELRAAWPAAPTALNLDMTYKPFNWYNYGQVADVTMSDPYYQARLKEAYWFTPSRIPLYSKATYVYAVAQLAQSAAAPNPLHIILYSCEYIDTTLGQTFPFPTPQSKRIEVYYALAGGAKGLSYWWFLPGRPSNGLGANTAGAQALWREIGLLGAEIGTAAPLLVTSCPAPLALQAGPGVWARSLLVGSDTFLLFVVNDQYANDPQGCHYTPVAGASLNVTLPAWMHAPTAFEISTGGTRNVTTQLAGRQLQLNLGTLDLTRMIVVTTNPQLRSAIQQRYNQRFRSRICTLVPSLCPPLSAPGDFDLDGDVDQADFGDFQQCVSGPTIPHAAGCDDADLDNDGDVDMNDLARFQTCFSGPRIPADQGCLD